MPTEQVPRAVATTTTVGQVVGVAAPAVGGLVLAAWGLSGALVANLVGYVGVLAALVWLRPAREVRPARSGGSVWAQARAGFASLAGQRELVVLLVCVAIVAGGLLPLVGLGLPLHIRGHGWGPEAFGAVEVAWTAATLLTGLAIAVRGPAGRPARMLALGPVMAAVGILGLSLSEVLVGSLVATAVTGVGVMLFTGHVAPLLIHLTPNELLSRYSAILQLVQVLPVLVLSPVLGVLIDHLELAPVLVGQAAVALCATLVVLSSRPLREVEIPNR